MSAFPLSLVDLSAIMIYRPPAPCGGCGERSRPFPGFSAEHLRLRQQLHAIGHEITWLGKAGIYAVTPSDIWARKEPA